MIKHKVTCLTRKLGSPTELCQATSSVRLVFAANVLPPVFAAKCLPIIHTLLEMATYRLTHMQPHYRMKILSSLLDELGSVNHNQLYIRLEKLGIPYLNQDL